MSKSSKKAVYVAPSFKWMKRGRIIKTLRPSFFSRNRNLSNSIIQMLKSSKKRSAAKVGSSLATAKKIVQSSKDGINSVKENDFAEEVQKVGDRYKRNEPRPPLPPLPCGSKLVYMGNLSLSIQESDVLNFFKDTGKVDWVEFGRVGNHFKGGYGHVRFETYEAGRKALERNGEELIDRPVKLVASEERCMWDLITPNSEYTYLFMGNLSPSIQENDVYFFKDDGKVEFVDLITEACHFLGYGHVKFASFEDALKAVQRDGEKLLDRDVELVLASETSVWYEYTPSSRKPPGFGVRRGPGYGPTR